MYNVVFLFGASCSGKSTLGQALYSDLGSQWTYIDRDDLIEQNVCSEETADATLDQRIKSIQNNIIVDAQLPWREKRKGELYFMVSPPLPVLLQRDAQRTVRLNRSAQRALYCREYVLETHQAISSIDKNSFTYCFDSSQESVQDEIQKVKSFLKQKIAHFTFSVIPSPLILQVASYGIPRDLGNLRSVTKAFAGILGLTSLQGRHQFQRLLNEYSRNKRIHYFTKLLAFSKTQKLAFSHPVNSYAALTFVCCTPNRSIVAATTERSSSRSKVENQLFCTDQMGRSVLKTATQDPISHLDECRLLGSTGQTVDFWHFDRAVSFRPTNESFEKHPKPEKCPPLLNALCLFKEGSLIFSVSEWGFLRCLDRYGNLINDRDLFKENEVARKKKSGIKKVFKMGEFLLILPQVSRKRLPQHFWIVKCNQDLTQVKHQEQPNLTEHCKPLAANSEFCFFLDQDLSFQCRVLAFRITAEGPKLAWNSTPFHDSSSVFHASANDIYLTIETMADENGIIPIYVFNANNGVQRETMKISAERASGASIKAFLWDDLLVRGCGNELFVKNLKTNKKIARILSQHVICIHAVNLAPSFDRLQILASRQKSSRHNLTAVLFSLHLPDISEERKEDGAQLEKKR